MADYRHVTSKAVRSVDGNSKEGRALAKDPAWQKCPEPATDPRIATDTLTPQPTPEPDGRNPLDEHPSSEG